MCPLIPTPPWLLDLQASMPPWVTLHPTEHQLHSQWRLQIRVTKGHYRRLYTTKATTNSTAQHLAPHHTTRQQQALSNYTSQNTRLQLHYIQLFTALTLEEYQLLSLQQTTPLDHLDYSRPLQRIPGDLRKTHYDSTLLSITMAEACNVHYYPDHYVVVKRHIEQELLLRNLTSGQLLHFTRDYISYMLSTQTPHYVPTSQHAQRVYKVDYGMSRFTEIYSLKNNYIWNYRMPLLLPDLLHYLNHHDQLYDFQYKAITTILHKSTHYYGFTLLTMTHLTQPQRL